LLLSDIDGRDYFRFLDWFQEFLKKIGKAVGYAKYDFSLLPPLQGLIVGRPSKKSLSTRRPKKPPRKQKKDGKSWSY
jgi:hypothetical protein